MNDENQGSERPKIIIDEDWKTQVHAEKEELLQREKQQPEGDTPSAGEDVAGEQLPPASMMFLITTLSAQTLAALGQYPDPLEGKAVVRLDVARLQIDTLAMLQEKTQGNLTDEESRVLVDTLHQLRMFYVNVESHVAQAAKAAGETSPKP